MPDPDLFGPDVPPMLTPAEVADLLRVTVRTVYRWLDEGLPAHRVGKRRLLVSRAELEAWLESR